MPASDLYDFAWRSRIVRRYIQDSMPTASGLRVDSTENFEGGAVVANTAAGANKEWTFAEFVGEATDFWEHPQEVVAFASNSFTSANPAGEQAFGITLGGAGSHLTGAVQTADADYVALVYNYEAVKWQLVVYAVGDAAAPERTDCTVQSVDPAANVWWRLLYIPNDPAVGGRKTIRCYAGDPARLIHTQKTGRCLNLGSGGGDYGIGLFLYSGTHASGRITNGRWSRVHGISHQTLPGG